MSGSIFRPLIQSLTTLLSIARDLVHLLVLVSRSRRALAAENLFLRKQLALFQERKVKPHRADDSTRLMMVILGRLFAWRDALVNVQPDTFIRWHRKGFRLLWRWKSRPPGRPPIPNDLRRLIREMAAEHPKGYNAVCIVMPSVQPSNGASRFLAERSADFVDETTPHKFLG